MFFYFPVIFLNHLTNFLASRDTFTLSRGAGMTKYCVGSTKISAGKPNIEYVIKNKPQEGVIIAQEIKIMRGNLGAKGMFV
jgi:hypothetical protein